jgi:hypothetical protein
MTEQVIQSGRKTASFYKRGLWVLCVLAVRWDECETPGVWEERQQFVAGRVTKSV